MPHDIGSFEALDRYRVPFVVIGGHAVNFHGYVRGTDDADVIWLRSPESEAALATALADLDAQYIGNDIDPATGIERAYPVTLGYIQTHHLMMLWTPRAGFLDLFSYPPGEPLTDPRLVYESADEQGGRRYVSFDWLIHLKRLAGRPKDLLDIEELERINGPASPPARAIDKP